MGAIHGPFPATPLWAVILSALTLAGSTPLAMKALQVPGPVQAPAEAVATPVAAVAPLRSLVPAELIRVIDGDTVEMRVLIWIDQHLVTRVRLRDIDAPEFSARCAEEARLAAVAAEALLRQLAGERLFLADVTRDKYGGRVVARILTGRGADVGAAMVREGHARPYAGSRRKGWCA